MKNIIYACTSEEMIRYCCESIKGELVDKSVTTEKLLDDCDVVAFSDKDPDSWGKKLYGKEVIPPSELPRFIANDIYIYIYIVTWAFRFHLRNVNKGTRNT